MLFYTAEILGFISAVMGIVFKQIFQREKESNVSF